MIMGLRTRARMVKDADRTPILPGHACNMYRALIIVPMYSKCTVPSKQAEKQQTHISHNCFGSLTRSFEISLRVFFALWRHLTITNKLVQ